MLAWPAGRVIVVVAGLIIIGVGVAGVIKGVKKSFGEEIDTSSMSPIARKGVARLGQVGYIAKGVALSVVGGLLSYSSLTFKRQKASGLDGALQAILAQTFGRYLLMAVALGFLAFGLFAYFSHDTAGCRARSQFGDDRSRGVRLEGNGGGSREAPRPEPTAGSPVVQRMHEFGELAHAGTISSEPACRTARLRQLRTGTSRG